MKDQSLIVYYSWVGSTEVVAKFIAEQTKIKIVKIEEVKPRPLSKIMFAAIGAFLGVKSKLKPMDFDMRNISTLLLGAQVWVGKTAPAINTYLNKTSFLKKNVWLFMTLGEDKIPLKVINKIKRCIEKKGGCLKGQICFQTHWEPEVNLPITVEEIKDKTIHWLEEEGFVY